VEAYGGGNNAVALDIFHQAAAIGVVDAMMYLGVMYGTGRGVDVDFEASRLGSATPPTPATVRPCATLA